MPFQIPRCQVIPDAGHQAVFRIDGRERMRWHFGRDYPRPFFYPLIGPSGASLTRMGHPGASNHDHHRSVWFAHADVSGVDFWSDRSGSQIRQSQWLCLQDGEQEAIMAVRLGWHDGHDPKPLLVQELIAAVRPRNENELLVELQSTFHPEAESLEFGKTNFGFLAVRVAKHISAYFGGGQLTNSAAARGEGKIFGHPSHWMDYSGPAAGRGVEGGADAGVEGVTYIDHPKNPGQPTRWHVREDGWMGASPCMQTAQTTSRKEPLRVRYLLHVHQGDIQPTVADGLHEQFSQLADLVVKKAGRKHLEYEVIRRA